MVQLYLTASAGSMWWILKYLYYYLSILTLYSYCTYYACVISKSEYEARDRHLRTTDTWSFSRVCSVGSILQLLDYKYNMLPERFVFLKRRYINLQLQVTSRQSILIWFCHGVKEFREEDGRCLIFILFKALTMLAKSVNPNLKRLDLSVHI